MKVLTLVVALLLAASPVWAKKKEPPKQPKPCAECPDETVDAKQPCYSLRPGRLFHRCEPQSLPYARCRTGNQCCRGNYELSPVSWYKCEDVSGHTSATPVGASVLILGDNSRHRMSTGHVFYVEKVEHKGGDKWELILSHTNYDRKCHIETNVRADYDARAKVLAMKTGHWSAWGKDLKAMGFIVK